MSRPIRSIQKQLRTRFWIDQIDRFEIIQFVNHDQTKNCGKIAAMRGRIAVMQTTIRWLWRDPFVELDLGASFEPLANNGMVGGEDGGLNDSLIGVMAGWLRFPIADSTREVPRISTLFRPFPSTEPPRSSLGNGGNDFQHGETENCVIVKL